MTLNADQILALAPDASSAKAGSQLAGPAKWGKLGRTDSAVWGECQGSGKVPYRTQIDLGEPAFKCSCPSRKFPCKHGIGLYLLLASHAALFAAGPAPQWVSDWLDGRQQRSEKKQQSAAEKAAATPEQAAAQAAAAHKREEKRDNKVAAGIVELQTWLEDLAREGLSTVRARGPAFWNDIAARMVDAQAGGLAARLRRASGMCFDTRLPDWETRLARELASLYLLGSACRRLPDLAPPLQSDVRALVGWTVSQEDVLAQAGVQDRWQVLAQHTSDSERVRARTSWLRGTRSGRWATIMHYAAGTQGYDKVLAPATEFDGELCFYPSAYPLRALIRQQDAFAPLDTTPAPAPTLDAALAAYADALARNPFLDRFPLLLDAVVPRAGAAPHLEGADGRIVPLHAGFRHLWPLLALSGGHPLTVMAEWDGDAVIPLSVFTEGRLHHFDNETVA
ncbi:SWIM zinc finger family protein [Massilia atriviolacea]|uniref:SWIM zinc finger family protein n=1 Tax=Massilia atriviolacea TaxID=2495579 RepID=A0A430HKD1_9BURK|nr:SWIM zinc finger family protein [Massilia atriviolacea]RSZ57997.1 SWIM zinc finger family protein [Massilia atriviolacea]